MKQIKKFLEDFERAKQSDNGHKDKTNFMICAALTKENDLCSLISELRAVVQDEKNTDELPI